MYSPHTKYIKRIYILYIKICLPKLISIKNRLSLKELLRFRNIHSSNNKRKDTLITTPTWNIICDIRKHVGPIEGVKDRAACWNQGVTPLSNLQEPSCTIGTGIMPDRLCQQMTILKDVTRSAFLM